MCGVVGWLGDSGGSDPAPSASAAAATESVAPSTEPATTEPVALDTTEAVPTEAAPTSADASLPAVAATTRRAQVVTKPRAVTKTTRAAQPAQPAPAKTTAASSAYYANCTAAWNAGAAPLHTGDPGYSTKLDRDKDGTACEEDPR